MAQFSCALVIGCIGLFFSVYFIGAEEPFQCRILYEFNGTSGDIYSPFYKEGSYPLGLWCEYRITAPVGYRLKLTFVDVDIYPYDFCAEAALIVYANEQEYVITKICGKDKPSPIITEPGVNVVRLLFTTEFIGFGKGFHLRYEAAPSFEKCPPEHSECHNRECYDASIHKCDGKDDCGDGTDEEGCNLPLAKVECGKPPIEPEAMFPDRIIGGQEVIPGSWPWQISMQSRNLSFNSHSCGGSLINAQWVLTAAHCFKGSTVAANWKVHIGKHHKYFTDPQEQIRYVERIIIWPDKTGDQINGKLDIMNDVALMKLNAPVTFTNYVRPACLPASGFDVPADTKCYVTGWGQTRGTGFNHVLKQTYVSVLSRYDCGYDEKSQICVKNKEMKSSTCHGDSGGPLSCKLGDRWYVMGATSYGTLTNLQTGLCAMPEQQTIFMKVSDKVDWIEKTINLYS
ncbi:chymotrypsin-like elastase family member 2A [Parasteatoda tepidariorum]|uniref:chymotrypsin-like elastase family member 2A n=1 Tax=Parasteatoda tepidariorum TaxID=114398 RepID=UPI00077FA581|nr:chymotrypsin-like elastase family member 2A [Parasteatoda tepidariorum]